MLKNRFLFDADENGGGSGQETKPEESGNEVTFDDFLKQGDNQAELDRRINKAVQTAIANTEKRLQTVYNEKLDEQERMAKMTAQEKADYLQRKQDRALAEREAAITRRELMAEAKDDLATAGLPIELAEVLVYTDKDTCTASLGKVKTAFQAAVSKAVEDKLKGKKPPADAGTEGKAPTERDAVAEVIKKALNGGFN